MKGQSLIVQFLLFFMIGLGLFGAIGGIFRLQSDIIREDIAKANRNLINSYVSSIMVSMANSCKECDFINYSIRLKNVTANYLMVLNLSKKGLQVSSEPGGGINSTSIHNLNYTLELGGNASSSHTIILRFNSTSKRFDLILKN